MLARMMNDFAPLMQLADPISQWLESLSDDTPSRRGYAAGYPGLNLWEDQDSLWLEAELPGFSIDDIEVVAAGRELSISGSRKSTDEPNATYHRRERATGDFSRTLALPWEFDAEHIEAKLVDGVLTVRLPKSDACKPRKVQITSA